jgi:hypothetical protein
MTNQSKHSHVPNEGYEERIKELADICDNEYYMSASPFTINKERIERGRKRIVQAVEGLKELKRYAICTACHDEINRQISLQEEGLTEIPKG